MEDGCFFCHKPGHKKKDSAKYAVWRVKKGIFPILVCSEINLASVPRDTWWVDSGATTHSHMCFNAGLPELPKAI